MEHSDITIAIFALIGALFGAVTSFLGTYLTLRHQESARWRENHLRELEKRRDDIDTLISDLGQLDMTLGEDGIVKLSLGSSPAARSVFYRLVTLQVREPDFFNLSLRNDLVRFELSRVLLELTLLRGALTKEIEELWK